MVRQDVDFFFFNDTATTEIYTLSLHDALPICPRRRRLGLLDPAHARPRRAAAEGLGRAQDPAARGARAEGHVDRSEEHTSELQSRQYLVCRLLLEKKKKQSRLRFTPRSYSALL